MFHLYSFCPVRLERTIAFPPGYVLAVGSSGVLAEKTGEAMAKYNRASQLVSKLLEIWRADTGRADRCLADALRSSADAPQRLRQLVGQQPSGNVEPAALHNRLEHFLLESEQIIPAAAWLLPRERSTSLAAASISRSGSPRSCCRTRFPRPWS